MMLGFLLARSGVTVTVLEKHADFLRDFRGDTVHPSTLMALDQVGLLPRFKALPQTRISGLTLKFGERLQPIADFHGLKPFDYLALVPQWDLLNLLAEEGRKFPQFDLRMEHEALGLTEAGGRVTGVEVQTPQGRSTIKADLVIGCDGRQSTLRKSSHFVAEDLGAPMDVLWFNLPISSKSGQQLFGIFGAGAGLILIDRTDYIQAGYIAPKGTDTQRRKAPIEDFHLAITNLAPDLRESVTTINSWDDVKTLEVKVDRLTQWHRPGLLLIGDAAHAMSPIGGVGINLAIQDSLAAANILVPAIKAGHVLNDALLQQVQDRRLPAVKKIQAMQVTIQNKVISAALESKGKPPGFPIFLRWLLKFRAVRNIPARIIGYGFDREDVET